MEIGIREQINKQAIFCKVLVMYLLYCNSYLNMEVEKICIHVNW